MTNANVSAQLSAHIDGSASIGTAEFDGALNFALALAAGTGVGAFDIAYFAERTVASATNDDIDLNAVLQAALGAALSFTAVEVVAIMIINRQKDGTANTTALTIGGGSNPVVGFSAEVLGIGAMTLSVDADANGLFTVTPATGDILRIANASGATNKYQIGILGRTA